MAEILLTQAEADGLIAMEKYSREAQAIDLFPATREVSIPLFSKDRREEFILGIRRKRIDIYKGMYQTRARKAIPLVRLDFGTQPHTNPDPGHTRIPAPHLHRYREGYGLRWAHPLPPEFFRNPDDSWQTFHDFMRYCSIIELPCVNKGLFS